MLSNVNSLFVLNLNSSNWLSTKPLLVVANASHFICFFRKNITFRKHTLYFATSFSIEICISLRSPALNFKIVNCVFKD